MTIPPRKHQPDTAEREKQPAFALNLQRYALRGVLLSVALNTIGQILFKVARLTQPDASLFAIFLSPQIWTAFIVYALSAVSWLWVLSRAELSFAYPILSLSFPVVVGLSAFFFAEPVSLVRWIGVGIIVLGVSLLART